MKRFLVLFLLLILTIGICGCDSEKPVDLDDDSDETIVLSEEEQRELYYNAVNKTKSAAYLWYDAEVSETWNYPSEETTETSAVQVKVIDAGSGDARYSALYTVGNDSFEYFYSNGSICSNESGEMYKSPMSEDEFCDYITEQMFLPLGEEFTDVAAAVSDDGTYTASLRGMNEIPEALAKHFYKAGASGLSLKNVTGSACVSESGYLLDNSVTFELTMNVNGQAVSVEYGVEINYQNLGHKFTVTLPDDEACMAIENIRTPLLIKEAYSNIFGRSYNASYKTLYSCNEDDYSMELNYNLAVSELGNGFASSDETVIDYDTVSRGRTVKRSSQYENGIQINTTKSGESETEMTDESARNHYFKMLLDYETDLDVFKVLSVRDMGSFYEIKYEYTDEGTKLYCQNVLTVLIEDQEGMAVHSEKYTVQTSGGTIRVDKNTETLTGHDINIAAVFEEDGEDLAVVFEHSLTVDVL